jgi:sugar O-acyltransferase (sialic acid O-acetyltransferase NeuD family)
MHVNVAIANSLTREQMVGRCSKDGISLFSLIAENAVVLDENEIGEGAIICPFSMITSNARIGQAFHANIYSYVAHDCVIGDYVTFAPGVKCNGNVVIEEHAYIGTGAILRQGKPGEPLVIGRGAIVGMGAVVTKSVQPGVTMVGNPARPLVK